MPAGTTWKHNKNIVENTSMTEFLGEFGDTIWEDQHDKSHVTMAQMMKQVAKETDPAVIAALEKRLQDFASNMA